MYHLIGTRTRDLSRKLAEQFMTMTPFPGDRPVTESRMLYLRREVEEGRFHGCEWATFECEETGETYRINGKHTSHIFADPSVVLPSVRVILKMFKGQTLQDGWACYHTYDDAVSSRTANDIIRSVAACIPDLAGVPHHVNRLCVQGMAIATFGVDYSEGKGKRGGKKERVNLLPANVGFCLFAREILLGELSKPLRRAPVTAAMYVSYEESPVLAKQFWLAVRDGTSPDTNAPDRDLQRFLMMKNLNIGGGTRGGITKERHVTRKEMFDKCVLAWKRWYGTPDKRAA